MSIEDLHNRLRDVIINTCNKIGCQNCDLKFDSDGSECSATDLQGKIMELEVTANAPTEGEK